MLREEVNKALDVLRRGGLILYPTDTIWGVGCDATNDEAIARIYQLKRRADSKSLIALLDTPAKLPSYVSDIPDVAYDLIEYAEHPLTIIYSNAKNLSKAAIAADGSIGIRIVKHEFCTQLLERFRKPIISTSANISGEPSPGQFNDISDSIRNGVDHIVNWEQNSSINMKPSTIMKLEPGGRFTFIRK